MDFKNIIYTKDKEKAVVKITINRPDVRNALNRATRQELRTALDEIKKDDSIRAVIFTGAGDKAFISGADLTELKNGTPTEIEIFASTLGQQLFTDIENLSIPAIAMINGFCLGAGCELAMACDIRIASQNAKLGQPEISVGIIPGGGGTQRLPRLIGWGKAKELIYTGKIIDAAEAARIGLVDDVVPQEKLEERVNQIVDAIVAKSPITTKLAKKVMNRGMYTDLASALSYEKATFALCFATEDQKEGMNAFMEKRKPQFKGK
jgi:enoyl-CoA hydratase